MRMFPVTLALLAVASAAQAETWGVVFSQEDLSVAVNLDRETGTPERRPFEAIVTGDEGDHEAHYLILNAVLDCPARTLQPLRVRYFNSADRQVRDDDHSTAKPEPVGDDPGLRAMERIICDGETHEKERFDSLAAFVRWAHDR